MANKKQRSILKIDDGSIRQFNESLIGYGGFKLIDFGVFNLKKVPARMGFNPHAQKLQKFPAHVVIKFYPSHKLRLSIQKWK